MKRIFTIVFIAVAILLKINAQTTTDNNVPIAVYIPSEIEQPAVRNLLENKLSLIVSQNGMSDDQYNPRFIIYPKISLLSRERTTTPPVLTVVELQVNIFIADFIDDKKFAATGFVVKGGGQSEERACLDAIKKIRNNSEIEKCLALGKQKIIEYYDQICDKVILQASEKIKQNQFLESIMLLNSIPKISDCFEKAQSEITQTYNKYSQLNCEQNLKDAMRFYAVRDLREALESLSLISKECDCYKEADNLYKDILNFITSMEEDAKRERDNEKKLALEREIRDYELIVKSMDYAYQDAQLERDNIKIQQENDYYKQFLKELFIEISKMQQKDQGQQYESRREQCITIIK